MAVDAPTFFGLDDHLLHDETDVIPVETTAVEGRVGGDRAQHVGDRGESALTGRVRSFDDDGCGSHAEDHAVTAAVERRRGIFHDLVGRSRSHGEEPGTDPGERGVARDVVGGDDHDPATASVGDPVLGDRHRLGNGGTGTVDLGVRPSGTDVLGELGVPHRQGFEEVLAVEGVAVLLQFGLHLVDAVIEFGGKGVATASGPSETGAQRLQLFETGAPGEVLLEAIRLGDGEVTAGEGGGEDDAGFVSHRVGEHPSLGKLRARGGGLVAKHERDARVAKCIEPCGDRKRRGPVEHLGTRCGDPVLLHEIDLAATPGELDHIGLRVDRFESTPARLALVESGDVMVDHLLTQLDGDGVDEHLASEELLYPVGGEHSLGTGQPETRPGDYGVRPCRRCGGLGSSSYRSTLLGIDLVTLLEEVGEQMAELEVGVFAVGRDARSGSELRSSGPGGGGRCGCRGRGGRRRWAGVVGRGSGSCGIFGPRARAVSEPGGVQAAERLVERHDVPLFRMVREQGDHIVVFSENVLDEAVQGLLRSHFDEDAAPGVVQCSESLDELDR